MQIGKLNPNTASTLNFPCFQKIKDFTATGSENSLSVTVDGDTDLEYRIIVGNSGGAVGVIMYLNNDSTSGDYYQQFLYNSAGSVNASSSTTDNMFTCTSKGTNICTLHTPAGYMKMSYDHSIQWTSGTTIGDSTMNAKTFNSTSNITSLDFVPTSSNFTSGTRILVYARRS